MRHTVLAVFLAMMVLPCKTLWAKDIPAQARIFAGSTLAEPQDLNTELQAQGLKDIDSVLLAGVEIVFPVVKFFDVGLRYSVRGITVDEESGGATTAYEAELKQDSYMAILRVPFLKTAIMRVDAYAGFGGTNTTVKVDSSTQNGEYTRKSSDGWFADTMSSFGASAAFGYKRFYFYVEGGVETNKVENLKRTGTVSANVDAIDLSGSYFTIGLLFDGVSASRR